MDLFIFLIYKVWFYVVDEENLLVMFDCVLIVYLVFYSIGIYIFYCGFIIISGYYIMLDLYNENDSLKDK